ncbi:MAG TPA: tetratricopeptide repeat protein [Candidatus Omnitrophica bacterium]|nr:MAG: hypothetical protein DRP69_00085 [Candidatus Omnitrophota bacterium]RKY44819.1 MAG: hypothetical protein DRP80_01230 [Candidatus Omnitrophota bacterium]HEC70122.1 tetratricopeptide repeat protein [Candidatus Omnitrophota bacterium]
MKKYRKTKRNKDFEIKFYEELIRENPNFIQAWMCLGSAYTKKGFYGEGLRVDLHLSKVRPKDPIVHYNLACSYSLLGDTTKALEALKKAIVLGYDDFSYLKKDKDLENLRKDKRFWELMDKVTRRLFKGVSLSKIEESDF